MPKRKRDDEGDDALRSQLGSCQMTLVRNLRIARRIERQKLGRRQKVALAAKDALDNARIVAEIQALKKLDLQTTAEHHLLKTLHRIKSIAATGLLPPHNPPASVPDTATCNVTARLYKAQSVKAALATTIQQVRQILGLDATTTALAGSKAKENGWSEKRSPVDAKEEEWQGFSDGSEDSDNEINDVSCQRDALAVSDSEDFADHDGRLASSDEAESEVDDSAAQLKRELAQAVANVNAGDDSSDTGAFDQGPWDTSMTSAERCGNVHDDGQATTHARFGIDSLQAFSKSVTPELTSHALAHSPSQLPALVTESKLAEDKNTGRSPITEIKSTDSDSSSLEQPPSPKLKPTSSAFLPSLTMGGYWSGSEGDEPEDIEEHVAPRKNRRGQRARQAIAEAKFGAAARHVVEGRPASKKKDGRDAGWDLKRGATGAESGRGFKGMDRKERRNRMKGAREAGASGGNAIAIGSGKADAAGRVLHTMGKPKRDDIGSLHPSWEAKRKAKAATGTLVPFQGKKIMFD